MSMPHEDITIFHNPRCGKSRSTLALLRERGIEPEVIEYLHRPPSKSELRTLVRKLGMTPHALVRTSEAVYKEHFLGKTLSDDEWLDALATHPILIERPIVVRGERAVIGRPPERILGLLE